MRRMRNFVSLIRNPLQANFILKRRAIYRTCNVLSPAVPATATDCLANPLCQHPFWMPLPHPPPLSTICATRVALFARRLPKARQLFIQAASQHPSSCCPCALELPSSDLLQPQPPFWTARPCLCIHLAGDVFVWLFFPGSMASLRPGHWEKLTPKRWKLLNSPCLLTP